MNIQMMEKEEKRHKETRYLVQLKGMLFVKKKKKVNKICSVAT